jgi:hypothetical protein
VRDGVKVGGARATIEAMKVALKGHPGGDVREADLGIFHQPPPLGYATHLAAHLATSCDAGAPELEHDPVGRCLRVAAGGGGLGHSGRALRQRGMVRCGNDSGRRAGA